MCDKMFLSTAHTHPGTNMLEGHTTKMPEGLFQRAEKMKEK